MLRNWTKRRKVSFWVHLVYVLIPALAALVAAVGLWTWVFGEPYFAIPLIACLEGVAALGFVFKLTKVNSPFVVARHFIPFFSVGTLAYELGYYLVGRLGMGAGIGFTAFIVAVFGTLFVQSFGVLERLVIDPVEAAREKATEKAQAILTPLAEHNAAREVFAEFTKQFRDAEGEQRPFFQLPSEVLKPKGLTQEQVDAAVQAALKGSEPAPAEVAARFKQALVEDARLDEMAAEALAEKEAGKTILLEEWLAEEPVQAVTAAPPVTWLCSACGAEGSNGSKGVAKKWSAARNLGDALYCADCRRSGKFG